MSPPYGGYNRFNTLKLGEDYLPLWLQKVSLGLLYNDHSLPISLYYPGRLQYQLHW